MHLTRQSRQFVAQFCNEKIYHHLLVEFNCDAQSLDDNIKETAQFYNNLDDGTNDWIKLCMDKEQTSAKRYEPCNPMAEGPMIAVNNSENPMVHSVTARGVQGALQTSILGVLSSPVIRQQLFYFSRHGESEYNVLGRIGGDADLSTRGRSYSERLAKYLGTTNSVLKPKLVNLLLLYFIFKYSLNFGSIVCRFGHQNCAEQFIQYKIFQAHGPLLRT